MQVQGSDSGRDVEPNLSLNGQRLQRDRLARSADEDIGTKTRSKGHFRRRASVGAGEHPFVAVCLREPVQMITLPVVKPTSRPTLVMVPV